MPPDLTTATLADLAAQLRSRAVRASDAAEAYLARIAAIDPLVRAYLASDAGLVRRRAEEADRALAAGALWGPLHGVPIALKDLIETAAFPTTYGSAVLRGARRDAAVVEHLERAGAIVLGKVSLHEVAFGVTNVNAHHGSPRNPWDLDRITGGSSGGSAAAVAARLCAGSIGTDTGGSVRIPSAFCGVVGLKPTHGRVSVRGVLPLSPSQDHVGPIARTVRDTALLFDAIADAPDRARPARPPAGLRVGVLRGAFFEEGVEPGVAAAFAAALEVLRALGCRIEPMTLPGIEEIQRDAVTILFTEAAAVHRAFADERRAYGEDVRALLQQGEAVPAAEYVAATSRVPAHRRALEALFARADLLASPTLPVVALRFEDADGAAWTRVRPLITRFMRLYNLTGLPALTVPCGLAGGLPVGLQLGAPAHEEATLLAAAAAFEQAIGLTLPDLPAGGGRFGA